LKLNLQNFDWRSIQEQRNYFHSFYQLNLYLKFWKNVIFRETQLEVSASYLTSSHY